MSQGKQLQQIYTLHEHKVKFYTTYAYMKAPICDPGGNASFGGQLAVDNLRTKWRG